MSKIIKNTAQAKRIDEKTDNNAAQSRKAVVRYITILFVSALFLILISYLANNRSRPHAQTVTAYYWRAGASYSPEHFFTTDPL